MQAAVSPARTEAISESCKGYRRPSQRYQALQHIPSQDIADKQAEYEQATEDKSQCEKKIGFARGWKDSIILSLWSLGKPSKVLAVLEISRRADGVGVWPVGDARCTLLTLLECNGFTLFHLPLQDGDLL